jgi:NodT family efflux transporter outer membrane factor (OMF) lipoprotein
VKTTQAQVTAGTAPYANLLTIQSQLASTEATLPPLRQRLDQSDHLLAALTGHTPADHALPLFELEELTLPTDLPLSVPSELVRQRPDILASEAQLHTASANIGVATAAMFPRFTLSGSFGQISNDSSTLLESSSSVWSLGANLTAPLFRGGSLWHQRKAAMQAYQSALANYRGSVLGGFQQVADTLRALEHDAESVAAQANALGAAADALKLVQANYRAGLASYLQVLVADQQYQQASIAQLQARAQRLQDTTALFVALGGGWWNASPEMVGAR